MTTGAVPAMKSEATASAIFSYRIDADSLIFMSICWLAGCGGSTGGRRGRRDVVDIDADDGGQIAKYILAQCQAHVNKPWA